MAPEPSWDARHPKERRNPAAGRAPECGHPRWNERRCGRVPRGCRAWPTAASAAGWRPGWTASSTGGRPGRCDGISRSALGAVAWSSCWRGSRRPSAASSGVAPRRWRLRDCGGGPRRWPPEGSGERGASATSRAVGWRGSTGARTRRQRVVGTLSDDLAAGPLAEASPSRPSTGPFWFASADISRLSRDLPARPPPLGETSDRRRSSLAAGRWAPERARRGPAGPAPPRPPALPTSPRPADRSRRRRRA